MNLPSLEKALSDKPPRLPHVGATENKQAPTPHTLRPSLEKAQPLFETSRWMPHIFLANSGFVPANSILQQNLAPIQVREVTLFRLPP